MPYNKEKQLLFIHIPKCGGTSIEKSLGSFSEIGVGIKNGKAIQHYTLKDYQNNLLFTNNFIKFSLLHPRRFSISGINLISFLSFSLFALKIIKNNLSKMSIRTKNLSNF